jgi:polyisoprenoid-binding protein YceI/rhodanese-related sulfurtransferase
MKPRIISLNKLEALIESEKDFTILNVLPKEYFEEAHIKNSLNACIYEIDFQDQVKHLVPDLNKTIVVHDLGGNSQAAAVAAMRLLKLGYEHVFRLAVGTTELRNQNFPLVTGIPVPILSKITDGIYALDPTKSTCSWRGRNITAMHIGTIDLKGGQIEIKNGTPIGGIFTLDMTTIANLDLTKENYKDVLEMHLKSDDFFAVEDYPEAHFRLTKASPIISPPGLSNYKFTGVFTLKNKALPISFPVIIGIINDSEISGQAHFDIDRTKWGVSYGSGKLFSGLLHHLVNDLISIELRLLAKKQ